MLKIFGAITFLDVYIIFFKHQKRNSANNRFELEEVISIRQWLRHSTKNRGTELEARKLKPINKEKVSEMTH